VKVINFKVFYRRNIYSHRKCIKLDLNLEDYDGVTSKDVENFNERLIEILPELTKHQCIFGEKWGFMKILKEGTYFNHICGHIAIALQNMAGADVSFCTESKCSSNNSYTVYEYQYKDTGIEAGKMAVDVINSLIENKAIKIKSKIDALKEVLNNEQVSLGMSEYSNQQNNRQIPIVAITGTNGKTTTTRLIAYIISKSGFRVGMTTTDGIFINGQCVFEGDTTGPRSALTVLSNCKIDVAVLETARGGMIRNGLAYDLADVAVITNITDDHLGLDGIETIEDLAKAKSLVAEAVKNDGYVVINGDDNMCCSILSRIKSKLIVFSEDKNNEVLLHSINNHGYGIYIDDGVLCIESSDIFIPLIKVVDISIGLEGALKYNIQNAMAACGALIGLGIDPFIIKVGLKSFKCNEDLNPGRFNIFDVNGVLTILDYGHNIDGYKSVLDGITQIKHKNLIGVIGVPGDRLDRTTLEIGRISSNYFHRIYIKEDKDRRGRLPGEIAELLKKGVLDSGFNIANIKIVLDEKDALEEALENANPGDIVITFFEHYDPLLKLVKEKMNMKVREPSYS